MRMAIGKSFLLVVTGLVAACSFQSSQLDLVRSALNREQLLPEHYWVLRLPNQSLPLVAVVQQPPHMAFVHPGGVNVVHDGWDIVAAYGWPERQTDIHIERSGDRQLHRLADGSTLAVQCDSWTLVQRLEWRLRCESVEGTTWRYENRIQLDDSGRIIRLHYALWPGLSPLELLWFPVSGENLSLINDTTP